MKYRQYLTSGLIVIMVSASANTISADSNAFSKPAGDMPSSKKLDFMVGRGFFKRLWVTAPASTQAADGLGPLFNARACMSCHPKNGRGKPPSSADEEAISMFLRIDIPAENDEQRSQLQHHKINNIPDPVYGTQMQHFAVPGHNAEYRLRITYEEIPVQLSDGETLSLRKPTYHAVSLGYGPLHPQARLSPRVAPPMIGLGLLEAIKEQDLYDRADPQDENEDGISGRLNLVWSQVHQKVMPGRFGLKAGIATVNEQSQSAFVNDIGISTPLFPAGSGECTDKQFECVNAPDGNSPQFNRLEAHAKVTDLVNLYVSNLAVPPPRNQSDQDVIAGKRLFDAIGCGSCHVSTFKVERYGKQQEIHPYTDLLLHDMGEGLADNRPEGVANGREWRTAPLWGIGLTQAVSGHTYFLHDGRARNLLEAILWHGGEAQAQRDAVTALDKKQREQLLKFIESI